MNENIGYIRHLVNHLLAQSTPEAMEKALGDLLTASEFEDVAKRLQIIEMLAEGIPQRQIDDRLGVGIATVTRGSNVLKQRKDTK
jgi:TrpR family trp operon transcriptional repressor